jgi:hypothetical protein
MSDNIKRGVYAYKNTISGHVMYIGSSSKTIAQLDNTHRRGDLDFYYNRGGATYNMTSWRQILRGPIAQEVEVGWIVKPSEMSHPDVLKLEQTSILEYAEKGEAVFNKDRYPHITAYDNKKRIQMWAKDKRIRERG